MVLEACMIVIDNSEYMRNGDYQPTRFGAQSDAVNVIFTAKVDSNPENTVGLMTMAGKAPEVLVTSTQDLGKVLSGLHATKIGGDSDLATGIQVAQLALKHRPNKSQRQRIVVFIGSPINADDKSLVKLGKKLKKNNIAVDIINFGEEEENEHKLQQFVDAVDSGRNSHLITIPPGPHLLSDILFGSSMFEGEDGVPRGMTNDDGGFGVDANMDPELAEALRLSLAEERQREAAAAAAAATATATAGPSAGEASQPVATAIPASEAMDEDEALLQQALSMSQDSTGEVADEDVYMGEAAAVDGEGEEDEEEAIRLAIEMSLRDTQEGEGGGK